MRETLVQIDEGPTFPALVMDGETWNGWVIPYFRPDVAAMVAAEYGGAFRPSVTAEAPCYVFSEEQGGHFRAVPSGLSCLYPIGAYYWCWSEATAPISGPAPL